MERGVRWKPHAPCEVGENPEVNVCGWRHIHRPKDYLSLYTYGINLYKLFSDGKGDFSNVEFIIHNDTDDYFVKAELNADEGVYYVTDHVENESDATHFIPVTSEGKAGKVIIKGLEDDTCATRS